MVQSIFQCKYCTKLFDNHKAMTKHEHSCATEKCPVCDKWMKKVNLSRHLQTVLDKAANCLVHFYKR